ncbi:MAG: response regulator [Planctomycetota bacterium]|nr:response regulator [Planctomycetota bacterium]
MRDESPASAKRLLLIDDDETFSVGLSRMLARAGWQVRTAAEGDEGLRLAAEERPDVILLDLFMPGKDGYAVSSDLHQIPGLAAVPIFVLTAFGQTVDQLHGISAEKAAHIYGFLEKPIDSDLLLEALERALTDRGSRAK